MTDKITQLPKKEYALALGRFRVATVETAVIDPDGNILLLKRKEDPVRGHWWICGSKVVANETLLQTSQRTLKNELNLDIDPSRIVDLKFNFFADWPACESEPYGEFNQLNIALIKITAEEKNVIMLRVHEHSEMKWVTINEVIASQDFLPYLVEVFTFIKKIG